MSMGPIRRSKRKRSRKDVPYITESGLKKCQTILELRRSNGLLRKNVYCLIQAMDESLMASAKFEAEKEALEFKLHVMTKERDYLAQLNKKIACDGLVTLGEKRRLTPSVAIRTS